MANSLTTNTQQVNKGLTPRLAKFKATLRRHRITTWQIAQASGLTDTYVWMVLNGRRRSAKVMETAERLIAERKDKA